MDEGMLPNSSWGSAAHCHPLGKIPEAEVWGQRKGVFIQNLQFGNNSFPHALVN